MANGKVISQLSVKTKTFNGTTNANGNLKLPVSESDIVLILSVYKVDGDGDTVIGIPYKATIGDTILHVIDYGTNYQAITNTNIAGTIYYL